MSLFFIFLAAVFISLISIPWIRKIAQRYHIGSLPSPRKLHVGFKPLLGGIGISLAVIGAILLAMILKILPGSIWYDYRFFWLGFAVIILTGLLDDVRGISSKIKFLGEGISAALLIIGGCKIQSFGGSMGEVFNLHGFAIPFTFLWIIFIMNAINLLDGLDGLAGGVGLIITAGLIIIGLDIRHLFLSVLAVGLLGGLAGFLRYNYHPSSIFMGEIGSLQLGYLLAFFSIENLKIAASHQVFFLVALVMFAVPMTDTLVSFLRRLGQGKSPFLADKEHIHHRLIKLGLSYVQTVWLLYVFTIIFVVLGLLIYLFKGILGVILFGIAFVIALFWVYRLGYVETRLSWQNLAHQLQHAIAVKSRAPLHFKRIWHRFILFLMDIITINLSLYVMYWLKFHSGFFARANYRPVSEYFVSPVFILILLGWLLLFYINNLYQLDWDISRFEKSWKVSKVITFGILLVGFITIDFQEVVNRSQIFSLLGYWLIILILVNFGRLILIEFEKRLRIFEYSPRKTLIVGTNNLAKRVYKNIQYNPHLIFDVKGFIAKKSITDNFVGLPVLGDYTALPEVIHHHKIEEVIIALPESASQDFIQILSLCEPQGVKIKVTPGTHEMVSARQVNLASHGFVQIFSENMVLWQWMIKRLFDILFSILSIAVLLPFLLPTGLYLLIKFRKSVLVKLPILGKNGIPFNMFVFRLTHLPYDYEKNPVYIGNVVPHGENDAFINFLFRFRFYKLPQLFNVMLGDMSLVGPRPEPIEWFKEFSPRLPFVHRRVTVRPGLTGLAQVKYHYELSYKVLKEWIKYDIYYTENLSLRMDLGILLRTVLMIFFKPYRRNGEVYRKKESRKK